MCCSVPLNNGCGLFILVIELVYFRSGCVYFKVSRPKPSQLFFVLSVFLLHRVVVSIYNCILGCMEGIPAISSICQSAPNNSAGLRTKLMGLNRILRHGFQIKLWSVWKGKPLQSTTSQGKQAPELWSFRVSSALFLCCCYQRSHLKVVGGLKVTKWMCPKQWETWGATKSQHSNHHRHFAELVILCNVSNKLLWFPIMCFWQN